MIEEGLVRYLQTGLAAAGVSVPGGFSVQIPKDLLSAEMPKAWAYRVIAQRAEHVLRGRTSWTELYLQIDCHGLQRTDSLSLAYAIDKVLRTFERQTLLDADQTFVDSILFDTANDGYVDASRSFVRSLEYRVNFHQK